MLFSTLDRIKRILNISVDDMSYDQILSIIIEKNELWLRSVCSLGDAPLNEELASVLEDLSVISYNRLGSEGLSSESVGPVSMVYKDVPDTILSVLSKYKKVRF